MIRPRLVIVESPYRESGYAIRNIDFPGTSRTFLEYARRAIKDSLQRGEAPFASHLLYTQRGVLRDDNPESRELGISAGHAWVIAADLLVVYTDYGVSPGMSRGIAAAEKAGTPVETRTIGKNTPSPLASDGGVGES